MGEVSSTLQIVPPFEMPLSVRLELRRKIAAPPGIRTKTPIQAAIEAGITLTGRPCESFNYYAAAISVKGFPGDDKAFLSTYGITREEAEKLAGIMWPRPPVQ